MNEKENDSRVYKYFFKRIYDRGCSGHLDGQDHLQIADEIEEFIKEIMKW